VTSVPPVSAIREQTGLSQPRFASLLVVSVRTLQNGSRAAARRRAPPERCCSLPPRTLAHSSMSRDAAVDVGEVVDDH